MILGCASYKLSKSKSLMGVMDTKITYVGLDCFGITNRAKNCNMFAGWGYGKYAKDTQKIAQKYHKPFVFIEDGFLRSPFVSSVSKQPYSLVLDTKAPYYDASVVTDLEYLICHTDLSTQQRDDTQTAINYFVKHKLGKFAIVSDNCNPTLPDGFGSDSILLKIGGSFTELMRMVSTASFWAKNTPSEAFQLKESKP